MSGTPTLRYDVSFETPISQTYSVNIDSEIPRLWTITNKTSSGFTVESNSTDQFSETVWWSAEEMANDSIGALSLSSPYGTNGITTASYSIIFGTSNPTYFGISFSGPTDIYLPTTSGNDGKVVIIKDESGNSLSNPIMIYPFGTETIDNSPTQSIQDNFGKITVISRNSTWWTI
jgi:hypothetical protein